MQQPFRQIGITGVGSISPMGYDRDEIWQSYLKRNSLLRPAVYNGERTAVAKLSGTSEEILKSIRLEKPMYKNLDRIVMMAIHCAREAVEQAGWNRTGGTLRTGVNIGSSRGATSILEERYAAYLKNPEQRIPPLTSPTTTLGNISSNVAGDIGADGPEMSHSVTCSTALHAVFNGVAWMRAGLADRFIVGGSEAPLTGFTVSQMKSLRIYTDDTDAEYPSRPCSAESPIRDMMALGEGAALFALENLTPESEKEKGGSVLGVIESFGYGLEPLTTATSMTDEGLALRKSMSMALEGMTSSGPVDCIILHAPGTVRGDTGELNAIRSVFGSEPPLLISNKWLVGHTFGASAALSLEYALLILAENEYMEFPYRVKFENRRRPVRKIMINAAGFGGNAASLIVSKHI